MEVIDLVKSVIIFLSNDHTQMVILPALTPECDSHSPALLDLFLSSYAKICSTMAFISQKLNSQNCWRIVFSTKVNLLDLLYSTAWKCRLLHLIKQNCLLKTFQRTEILMTQVSLSSFPSGTNLKLHNIFVTPKMVKKFIINLDL